MTIGTQPTEESLNEDASDLARLIRDTMQAAQQFGTKIVQRGNDGLEDLQFDADSAQEMMDFAGQCNNLAGVFYGTATVTEVFDFDQAFALLYG
jgi:hypothetical protein